MPKATIVEIPQVEQERMLAELRRARYGYVLVLHILLLCAAGRTPTEIAIFAGRAQGAAARLWVVSHEVELRRGGPRAQSAARD